MMAALTFQLQPWSLAGVALLLLFVLLGLLHWRRLGALSWRRRITLMGLRSLLLLFLFLVVLGPERTWERTLPVKTPETLVANQFRSPPEARVANWLPPVEVLDEAFEPKGELRIRSLGPPIAALYKNRDRLAVELEAELREDLEVQVLLYDLSDPKGRQEIGAQRVSLQAGRTGVTVDLPFIPNRLSGQVLGVLLQCPRGLVCPAAMDTVLVEVIRPQIRILHLAGHPSWDLRFLREYLKTRPRHELISFYVLASQDNFQPLPPEDLALIPFPTNELFLQELPGFDLLIVQDFSLGSYFLLKDEHLAAIRDFVAGGGGLLFIGGPAAFASGSLEGTVLEKLLPATLPAPEAPDEAQSEPSPVILNPAQSRHPVLRFRDMELPPEFPPLAMVNRLGAQREGTAVLLQQRDGLPVLSAGRFEKGRVALLATDSLWSWAFSPPDQGNLPGIYSRLLDNLVAWLSGEPGFDDSWLEEKPNAVEGQPTTLRLCTQAGIPEATLGQRFWPLAAGEGLTGTQRLVFKDGCASLTLPAVGIGAWKLELDDGSPEGLVQHLAVRRSPEGQEARLGRVLARALPQPPLPPRLPELARAPLLPPVAQVQVQESQSLWDNPWLLGLLMLLLGADWVLRRKSGLP